MYLIFAGSWYYPAGGWQDFVGIVPGTLEDVIEYAKSLDKDWAQVVELGRGIVWSK